MLARCSPEDDYIVKINEGRLSLDGGLYEVHDTLKGGRYIFNAK